MGAMTDSDRKVDFGFEKVAPKEKAARVRAVFTSVAGKYNLMNDLMSFGAHRLWKRFALSLTGLKSGQSALDVAGGTGDPPLRRFCPGCPGRRGGALGIHPK